MAQVANTFSGYDAVGVREDLADVIYNISPEETPVMNLAGRTRASNTLHEWQTDALAAAAQNAHVEGDETAFDAQSATTRVGNYTQIAKKAIIVSGTLEAMTRAGRRSEMQYLAAKASAEIKRDMENDILASNPAVAGDDSTARELGGLPNWIKTNDDRGGSGADPSYSSVPTGAVTDGTQRAFTEDILKDVLELVWTSGGSPSVVVMGAFNKGVASGFAGVADQRWNVSGRSPSQAVILGAADVYVGDFSTVAFVPDRFIRARDAFAITPDMLSLAFLRDFKVESLAKTGDAEKRHIIVEYTLRVNNEAAHGHMADLTTS